MPRIKQTKSINATSRAAKKQLKFISKLQSRFKGRTNEKQGTASLTKYGTKQQTRKAQLQQPEEVSKRRWRPGTVAKREIRKLSRTTNLMFPRSSFSRVVREICQDTVPNGTDIRFTPNSLKAIQEAAETFVTETFHKADLARLGHCTTLICTMIGVVLRFPQ
jgi:histone H3/H4